MLKILIFKIISISILISIFTLSIIPCSAAETWQSYRLKAQSADVQKRYTDAIKLYEKAISLLPDGQENERICLEASAIIDLRLNDRMDESIPHFNALVKAAKFLEERKALKSESLFSIHALIDSGDMGPDLKLPYEKQHHFLSITMAESIELCQIAFPEMLKFERFHRLARNYIALSDRPGAEMWLKKSLQFKTLNTEEKAQAELELATLQSKMGRPQALQKLSNQLYAHESKAKILRKLADASIWIADYAKASSQLDEALAAIKKQPDPAELYSIYDTLIYRYMDVADYKNAEKYLRIQLQALEPVLNVHSSFRTMQQTSTYKLISVLKLNHKNAEAQAIKDKLAKASYKRPVDQINSRESDFFLSDKDKQDLRQRKPAP